MIDIAPFRAWRPAPDKTHLVASRSYVSYPKRQLELKLKENPFTFLHVITAGGTQKQSARRSRERFQQVRARFEEFCEEGILIREVEPAFYIYEQLNGERSSIGVIAAVPIKGCYPGSIKKHEQTLSARERLFADYLEVTQVNAEPVLLAAPSDGELDLEQVLRSIAASLVPVNDISTKDRIRHRLWVVSKKEAIDKIKQVVRGLTLYIADGHHRCASSARVAEGSQGPDDPREYFMALIVPQSSLHIMNYDRTVKDLGGRTLSDLMEQLTKVGTTEKIDLSVRPGPGQVVIHSTEGNHLFTFPPRQGGSPSERTDVARLSDEVLGPILGITDLRSDPRIGFVPGNDACAAMRAELESGKAKLGFELHPVPFEQLQEVADVNGTMPPKSTWIEPKLRSGLTIYSLRSK